MPTSTEYPCIPASLSQVIQPDARSAKALRGVKVVSLSLNLPGPAALWRCRQMGATCIKVEPPSGDPMRQYSEPAFDDLHAGIQRRTLDLKTPGGQQRLHRLLKTADVLLTSFRPSALNKLQLDWPSIQARHPQLNLVAIVGGTGAQADVAGHDLTYMAESDLVSDLNLPSTLFADMTGALQASEAVLQALLTRQQKGAGVRIQVSLAAAAQWQANPRRWGLTAPNGVLGGQHAGYRVYACLDGRVAVAALEPHFAKRLVEQMGQPTLDLTAPTAQTALARWFKRHSRHALDEMAAAFDLPMHTMAA